MQTRKDNEDIQLKVSISLTLIMEFLQRLGVKYGLMCNYMHELECA